MKRVANRANHFMKPEMVRSQILALEEPGDDEKHDVVSIDATNGLNEVSEMAFSMVERYLHVNAPVA